MEIKKFENSNIELVKENMTSIELANFLGKRHKNMLVDLRQMSTAWQNITGLSFQLSEYKDMTGRVLPMYTLNKSEILFVASKYDDELRAKIIIRLTELEYERIYWMQVQLDKLWDKEDQKDLYKK